MRYLEYTSGGEAESEKEGRRRGRPTIGYELQVEISVYVRGESAKRRTKGNYDATGDTRGKLSRRKCDVVRSRIFGFSRSLGGATRVAHAGRGSDILKRRAELRRDAPDDEARLLNLKTEVTRAARRTGDVSSREVRDD